MDVSQLLHDAGVAYELLQEKSSAREAATAKYQAELDAATQQFEAAKEKAQHDYDYAVGEHRAAAEALEKLQVVLNGILGTQISDARVRMG